MTITPMNTMDPLQQVMLPPLMAVTGGSEHVVIGLIDGPVHGASRAGRRAAVTPGPPSAPMRPR